jgi:hypothetical protein
MLGARSPPETMRVRQFVYDLCRCSGASQLYSRHSIHGWAAGFSNGDLWTFDLMAGAPYAVRSLSSPPENRSTSAATPLPKSEDTEGGDGISSLDTVRVTQRDSSSGGGSAAIVATLMSGKIFLGRHPYILGLSLPPPLCAAPAALHSHS